MPSHKDREACLLELSNTASDMLVGLKCLDTPEVVRVARRLKELANEYGASMLGVTARNIEHAATAGDLGAAQLLVPELLERLDKPLELLN